MFEKIKENYEKVKGSADPESYLCSVFLMCAEGEMDKMPLQFDFFSKGNIKSFIIDGENVKEQVDESFNEAKKDIDKLELDKVNVPFDEAFGMAKTALQKHPDSIAKVIVIIQVRDNVVIWNISFITKGLYIFNMKVNAESGEVIREDYSSLMADVR